MTSKIVIWTLCMFLTMGFFLPALLSAPPAAGSGSREGPGWQEGDKWAFGDEENFSRVFDDVFRSIEDEIAENASGFVVYAYQKEGVVGFYYESEVVNAADGLYEIRSTAAIYFHVFFAVKLDFTGLPVEGNHSNVREGENDKGQPTWEGVETTPLTVQAEAGLDVVVKSTQINYFTQDGLNLSRMDYSFEVGVEYTIMGKNIPEVRYSEGSTYDEETDTETYDWMYVEYHDASWEGRVSADVNLNMRFTPAVNLFDLPIVEGEVWNGTTDVTVSGDLGGVIDLEEPRGVPADVLQDFYDDVNEGLGEAKIDKTVDRWNDLFPLYIPNDWLPLEDLDENVTVQNNRFVLTESVIADAEYSFTTGENRTITLDNGTEITVYEIVPYDEGDEEEEWDEEGDGETGSRNGGGYDNDEDDDWDDDDDDVEPPFNVSFFVSPDDGRLMKMEVESEPLEEAGVELEAEPVEPVVAETAIGTRADPKEPRKGGTNEFREFALVDTSGGDDDTPGFGLWGVVVAAAVSGNLMRRRKR